MNMLWVALTVAAACVGVSGTGCGLSPDVDAPPYCPPPDGGQGCSCPGTSVGAIGCAETFTCLADRTWAPYDASCLTPASEGGSIPGDAGVADAMNEQ